MEIGKAVLGGIIAALASSSMAIPHAEVSTLGSAKASMAVSGAFATISAIMTVKIRALPSDRNFLDLMADQLPSWRLIRHFKTSGDCECF